MGFHKLKRNYIRYVLRPARDLRLSLVYFYSRIALSLAIRGIKLPGYKKIKARLPLSVQDAYERKILVYNIKGERYFVRKGPLFLRKLTEIALITFNRNKFWMMIVLKLVLAVCAIAIPVSIFIIIRGVLPVPERVPYEPVKIQLAKNSNLRVDWYYTEAPFKVDSSSKYYNYIDPENTRGVSVTPVLAPQAPAGLMHFGVGYYPTLLTLMRGFLVGNSSSLTVERQAKKVIESGANGDSKLRIQYYLFPSKDGRNSKCKLELKDQDGNILAQAVEDTPQKYAPRSPYSLTTAWRERFIPNTVPDFGYVKEFVINQKKVPEKIIATATDIWGKSEEQTTASGLGLGHNLSNDNCIFALGDFSYESPVVRPLKRRGIIFILVDTLRADTAYDKKLMPRLNNFAQNEGMKFLEHRAQGNMTVPSVLPLMTSRYARELGTVAFSYAVDENLRRNFYARRIPEMPVAMQNLGYRVGGIGWLSLFSEALQGGMDIGFHNVVISESNEYEARQITEQMASWLETYGDAPFFLYVHYNTMHGPYKPPLGNIDLKTFLSKPFGIAGRQQLYNGLGRYFDDEFANIVQKLKDLGIYDDVDIILTADHGAQMTAEPWKYFSGVDQKIEGGYADKGHTLFDEEVRIPLIMRLADDEKMRGVTFSTPTAHVDLFPTLYDLAGGDGAMLNKDRVWRGINFYPAIRKDSDVSLADLLQNRKSIYFDGHNYAGMLYWGDTFADDPTKYIRQFAPDEVKLYLGHNPWSERIKWFQPEAFSSVNFKTHTERWLPIIANEKLLELRKKYFDLSPSDKVIKFTAKYDGPFSLVIKFKKELTHVQNFSELSVVPMLPDNMHVLKTENNGVYTYSFSGKIKKDQVLGINSSFVTLLKIELEKNITPIICANGNKIQDDLLLNALENNYCAFFSPPEGIIEYNYKLTEKPVIVQKSLTSEKTEQVEGTGAGAALQTALREWGYAK